MTEFVCTRTSLFDDEKPPHPSARIVSYERVDLRTIDDPMKSPYIGAAWYESGRNHRVENGMIARDFDDERWVIEIDTMEELLEFVGESGEVVLSVNDHGLTPCMEIEIYDSYRE